MSSLPLPNPIIFQQTGPFYDMVGAFVTALSGLESIVHPTNPMEYKSGQMIALTGKVHSEIRYDVFDIYQLAFNGTINQSNTTWSLCNMLINTAYESVRDQDDHSPEFEFFRHIRNASSHKNTFNFFPHEPSRLALWRGCSIDDSKKGNANPLFGQPCFGGLLGAGDALVLLSDIECKLGT